MILYTIFDPNVVFKNGNYGENQINEKYIEVSINGVMVQASQSSNSDLRVERIISTNPFDYLNTKIQPGCIIKK
jgi:hypothetical protein